MGLTAKATLFTSRASEVPHFIGFKTNRVGSSVAMIDEKSWVVDHWENVVARVRHELLTNESFTPVGNIYRFVA